MIFKKTQPRLFCLRNLVKLYVDTSDNWLNHYLHFLFFYQFLFFSLSNMFVCSVEQRVAQGNK